MKGRENFPIERQGINYVRNVVEIANCRYNEIIKDNDFGIDAIIELLYKNKTTGKLIAIQIKSGKTYCNKNYCWIRATKSNIKYWKKHSLPVFGIVYDPNEKRGYWINISEEIKNTSTATIKFEKDIMTIFDEFSFKKWIRPKPSKKDVIPSFSESVRLAKSNDPIYIHKGMGSLSRYYKNKKETWEIILNYFKNTKAKEIPDGIVHVLSTIPGHHGQWSGSSPTKKKLRYQILEKFSHFNKKDVIKLLYPIDEYAEESGEFFPRGNTAHCAAVIIDQINNKNNILKSIVLDVRQNSKVRKYALVILASNIQERILPILHHKSLKSPKFELAIDYLTEWLKDKPRYELFSQW